MVDRRACDTANGNANGNARQCSEDAHIAGKIAFQPAMLQREPAIRHYLQYWPKPANALGDRQCPYLVLPVFRYCRPSRRFAGRFWDRVVGPLIATVRCRAGMALINLISSVKICVCMARIFLIGLLLEFYWYVSNDFVGLY